MAKRQIHVVYGYPRNVEPIGDAPIMGFGKSDQTALADAKTKGWIADSNQAPVYYYVRSNGDRVPCGTGLAGRETAMRSLRRYGLGRFGKKAVR